MEELNVTPLELKDIITDSKLIGRGFFGSIFTYKDKLIKLDTNLYNLLNINDRMFSEDIVDKKYRYVKDGLVDKEQIEALFSKQKDITLTRLPLGIVTVKGYTPGIILPYHRDHANLVDLPKNDYRRLLAVLRKLLLAVEELAANKIAQNDLHICYEKNKSYNVLYKDDTPQIIDLDGHLVLCDKNFKDAKTMYNELGEIVFDYLREYKIRVDISHEQIDSKQGVNFLIDSLETDLKKR